MIKGSVWEPVGGELPSCRVQGQGITKPVHHTLGAQEYVAKYVIDCLGLHYKTDAERGWASDQP